MFHLEKNLLWPVPNFVSSTFLITKETETLSPKGGMKIISLISMQNVPIYRQFLTFKEKSYKNTEQLSIYIRSELNV